MADVQDVYSIATGYGFLNDAEFSGTISSMITVTTTIAGILLFAFVALKFGYEYFKASIPSLNDASAVGRVIDFDEIIRIFVLITLLAMYPSLTKSVTSAIRKVNDTTNKSSAAGNVFSKVMDDYYYQVEILPIKQEISNMTKLRDIRKQEGKTKSVKYLNKQISNKKDYLKQKELQKNGTLIGDGSISEKDIVDDGEDGGFWDNMWSGVKKLFTNIISPQRWVQIIVTELVNMFTGAIDWGISAFIRVTYKILLVIGPLAIATSVFWKDKFMGWFEALLNTGLAFTVLNILSLLKSEYLNKMMSQDTDILAVLSFNVAIIGCYFTVFRLTAMWVGKPLAGAMMSRISGGIGAIASVGFMTAGAGYVALKNSISRGKKD